VSIAGLILAAGESRRMGFPKALLQLDGETFLDRLIAALSPHCAPVIVVLGHRAAEVHAGVRPGAQALFVVNERYAAGQFSSLQCGLRAVPRDSEGVLFTLVDHPLVSPATIEELLTDRAAAIAIPRYQERRGHPVYVSAALVSEFLSAPETSRARDVIGRHENAIRYVEVHDPGVIADIDTPEAYRRLAGGGAP
jgi:molybdenum cofactor cytidylyltransferase